MYKISFVHKLTKILVDIFFYLGILCTISVPFVTAPLLRFIDISDTLVIPTIITLVICGICAVYILLQLKRIFKTLLEENPFVMDNVNYLRRMSVAAFIVAIMFFVKCFYWFTFATAIIVIVFVIAGFFCLTLKDVFKQAVIYKDENDLTV